VTLLDLDRSALIWINSHHNAFLDAILAPIAYAGECGALWIAVGLTMLIAGKPAAKRTALVMLITMIVVDRLIAYPLGNLFERERPYLAMEGVRQLGVHWTSGSFPSGHAHNVWVAAVILGTRWRRLAVPLAIFALLTCYSRPYFGMHYPLDAVAGAALGIAAGFAAVAVDRRLFRRERARSE
jgi:undecaprenyl-diphosphatase